MVLFVESSVEHLSLEVEHLNATYRVVGVWLFVLQGLHQPEAVLHGNMQESFIKQMHE